MNDNDYDDDDNVDDLLDQFGGSIKVKNEIKPVKTSSPEYFTVAGVMKNLDYFKARSDFYEKEKNRIQAKLNLTTS